MKSIEMLSHFCFGMEVAEVNLLGEYVLLYFVGRCGLPYEFQHMHLKALPHESFSNLPISFQIPKVFASGELCAACMIFSLSRDFGTKVVPILVIDDVVYDAVPIILG